MLVFPHRPEHPRGVVLMLHGGEVDEFGPLRRLDPSAVVMRVMTDALAKRVPNLAFVRLLNAVGGWNEPIRSPVADAEWALMRLRQEYPRLPIGVVGHSMGGRTAFELAADHDFAALVGLAPWLADGYGEKRFVTTHTLIVHGRVDPITSQEASADLVRRIRTAGGSASFLSVPGGHALSWRTGIWQRQVAAFLRTYVPQT